MRNLTNTIDAQFGQFLHEGITFPAKVAQTPIPLDELSNQ